jgi:hypothetical protein
LWSLGRPTTKGSFVPSKNISLEAVSADFRAVGWSARGILMVRPYKYE